MKDAEIENLQSKCTEILEQCFAQFSRVGVINSCSGFQLGWDMALCSPNKRTVADPDAYDLMNHLDVGNYQQKYYIEKENLRINFVDDEQDEEIPSEASEKDQMNEQSQIPFFDESCKSVRTTTLDNSKAVVGNQSSSFAVKEGVLV